ncbi:MAG: hypothetical protein HY293_04920 [Planctomycetes bacterium]|nr:hypothetical protein [Planctomycetota bacterium]
MRTILAALLLAPLFAQDADVQKVIQQLGSSSFEEQGKAATILEGLGREALPDLETATKSGNAQIRDWACGAPRPSSSSAARPAADPASGTTTRG